ncbi:hypothetical protein ES708_17953 [subsurface metagenome]
MSTKGESGTKTRVRINPKTGVLYIPKELLNDGFRGDVDALSNAMTFTIIHPSADLEKVKESLEITLRDIELRLARESPRRGDDTETDYPKAGTENEA